MKIKNLAIVLLLIISSITIGYAQFSYNPKTPVPFDPACKRGALSNGVEYMIWPYKIPEGKASFYAFLRKGALEEKPNEYGLAHFMEHLIGGKLQNNKVKEYCNYFRTLGLSEKGDLNAHAGLESTRFDITSLPTQNVGALDTALLFLKGSLFNPDFDSSKIERERGVVIEEWRLGSALNRLEEQSEMAALKGSVYSRPHSLGDPAELKQLSVSEIKNFYYKCYRPECLTIIAIGDFNPNTIRTKIEQIFGTIPKNSSGISPKETYTIPDLKEPVIQVMSHPEISTNKIEIHYKINRIAGYNQEQLKTEYIHRLTIQMIDSRLKEIINMPDAPFVSFGASFNHIYFSSNRNNEYAFEITPGKDSKRAFKAFQTENERIIRYGFTENELKKAKDALLYFFTSGIVDKLPSSEIFMSCYSYLEKGIVPASNDYLKKFVYAVIPDITLNEINERYKKYTSNTKPVISLFCPETEKGNIPTISEIKNIMDSTGIQKIEPYVDKKDEVSNLKLFNKEVKPGQITKQTTNTKLGTTEWILSNGVHVVIKTTDFKKDEIQFAGLRLPDTSKFNKEYLAVSLISPNSVKATGTDSISRFDLDKMLSNKKITFEYLCSKEKQGMQGNFPPGDFETALQLMNLSFSDRSWATRDTFYQAFSSWSMDLKLLNVIYDSIKKYSGIDDSFFKFNKYRIILLENLNHVYKPIFSDPDEFTFLFSGNLQPDKAKPLIEKYLGSLTPKMKKNNEKESNLNVLSEMNPEWWKTGNRSCEFKYPMAIKKAEILVRCQGTFSQSLTNSVYCDLAQRLLEIQIENAIREKYGATYMVGSFYSMINSNFAQFSTHFSTDPSIADQMKIVAADELKKFMEEGPKENDFNIRKSRIIKQKTEEWKTNKWWVNSALYEYYFHQKNIVPTYIKDISNISLEGLREFTRNIYNQGNIISVVVKPE